MRQRQLTWPGDKALGWLLAGEALSTAQVAHAFDQVVKRFSGLSGVDGQGDQPLGHGLRDRELAWAKAPLLKRGGVVQRRVMSAYFDAPFVEHGVDEIVFGAAELAGVNLDGIQMEDMFAAVADGWECYSGYI